MHLGLTILKSYIPTFSSFLLFYLDIYILLNYLFRKVQEVEEVVEDGDDNHRQIGDLKGDLEGYKSDEDPDYVPEVW